MSRLAGKRGQGSELSFAPQQTIVSILYNTIRSCAQNARTVCEAKWRLDRFGNSPLREANHA